VGHNVDDLFFFSYLYFSCVIKVTYQSMDPDSPASRHKRRKILGLNTGPQQVPQTDGTHGHDEDSRRFELFDTPAQNFLGESRGN
jgi:hypothetical protein